MRVHTSKAWFVGRDSKDPWRAVPRMGREWREPIGSHRCGFTRFLHDLILVLISSIVPGLFLIIAAGVNARGSGDSTILAEAPAVFVSRT